MDKKTHFAEHSGKFYVRAESCGIDPLIITTEIGFTVFSGEKIPYVKIEDAISWHENEIKATGGKWRRDFLEGLIKAKQAFESGKVEFND